MCHALGRSDKRPTMRHKHKSKEDIEANLKEIVSEVLDWVHQT
jgi:hypothetical protein